MPELLQLNQLTNFGVTWKELKMFGMASKTFHTHNQIDCPFSKSLDIFSAHLWQIPRR